MRAEGRTAILRRMARLLLYAMTATRKPSAATWAARAGISLRSAYRDLSAFEEAGWIWPSKATSAIPTPLAMCRARTAATLQKSPATRPPTAGPVARFARGACD